MGGPKMRSRTQRNEGASPWAERRPRSNSGCASRFSFFFARFGQPCNVRREDGEWTESANAKNIKHRQQQRIKMRCVSMASVRKTAAPATQAADKGEAWVHHTRRRSDVSVCACACFYERPQAVIAHRRDAASQRQGGRRVGAMRRKSRQDSSCGGLLSVFCFVFVFGVPFQPL